MGHSYIWWGIVNLVGIDFSKNALNNYQHFITSQMLRRWIVLITGVRITPHAFRTRKFSELNARSCCHKEICNCGKKNLLVYTSGLNYTCGVLCAWNQYEDRWGYENLVGLNMKKILWISDITVRLGKHLKLPQEKTYQI